MLLTKKELEEKLEDYLDEELADEKSKNTMKHYRHVITMFIDSLPDGELSKRGFMDFKDLLISKYKPKTVNNYIVIVNKFIKYLEILDENDGEFSFYDLKKHKSKNTLKNIKLQQEASLKEVLEPSELKRMLRVAKQRGEMDLYYLMKVLSYTGIRAEELKIFTVENIKSSNYIKVSNKGKIRNVIVRNDLRRELIKYCKDNKIATGYIFKGKKEGAMMHSTTIYKRLKKLAGACKGIKKSKVHAHSFRHLFAIKFLQDGGDISELADILGHSSIETTRIYVRTTDKMKKDRLEKMKY